jgi:signal transduction histidine kinase
MSGSGASARSGASASASDGERAESPARSGRADAGPERKPRGAGFLAQLRIRKKLILLHTFFSLGLATILLLALRPALAEVIREAEMNEAKLLARLHAIGEHPVSTELSGSARVEVGTAAELGVDQGTVDRALRAPGEVVERAVERGAGALAHIPGSDQYVSALVVIPEARAAVKRLYILLILALLGVYALVAAALEVFVLPGAVYDPIRRLLDADRAVQEGRTESELIPEPMIPADELGEIMRSRNGSIVTIRKHERDLAEALNQLEEVASDLARKNHLLERAKRNIAESDRLASLGMMSAGIAHELNTPLAVLKGLVEQLTSEPAGQIGPAQARLMLRVVGRLERLSESLLDFARARAAKREPCHLRALVDESMTLVKLDRETQGVHLRNEVPKDLVLSCDADRIVQVLVNLIRNAADAIVSLRDRQPGDRQHAVVVQAGLVRRDGDDWVSLTVTDSGPGIDKDVIQKIFEPFVSTGLDARGTGLGLAVVDGIVREHGGLVLARNLAPVGDSEARGAVFEVLLPREA